MLFSIIIMTISVVLERCVLDLRFIQTRRRDLDKVSKGFVSYK